MYEADLYSMEGVKNIFRVGGATTIPRSTSTKFVHSCVNYVVSSCVELSQVLSSLIKSSHVKCHQVASRCVKEFMLCQDLSNFVKLYQVLSSFVKHCQAGGSSMVVFYILDVPRYIKKAAYQFSHPDLPGKCSIFNVPPEHHHGV